MHYQLTTGALESMKIAIMGSGGIGAYYGVYLAEAGHDVVFIARGSHLQAMQKNGLRLTGSRGDVHIKPAQATDNPFNLGAVDVVLFCVKLYDTETAAELIRPLLAADTMVISLQNGIDGADRIASVLGERHALGGSAYVSAKIVEPGVVSYTSNMSRLIFGEVDGGPSTRAQHFAETCDNPGFTIELLSLIHI